MSRVYFHIDLNAFYANAEVLLDPELKGKPLVVSGHTRRSVVSTASYEARKYGIHSAMPISEAEKLCRDLIIIPGHYHYYSELSHMFIGIIKSYTNEVEQASIDECYADMTDVIMKYEKPLDLAWDIQKRVLKEVGIPCSIGIGPNMFLAKMASDMKKPMGITVLRIRDVPHKMWPLHIKEMRGVGSKTLPLLEEMNIHTIGDLANFKDTESLKPIFGKNTEEVIRKANGYDERILVKESDNKSMGVSETFLEDVVDYDELRGQMRILAKKLSTRLHSYRIAGHSLSIRICYYDFRNASRTMRLPSALWRSDDLFVNAMTLFDENWDEGEAVRLLGISVSDFASESELAEQINLFNMEEAEKEETDAIIKDLNSILGMHSFVRASTIMKGKSS
ncbi:MAG: DNA polymerase IV [Solobacterium sp.]|nr:DNA polymerase IV [Solobacterium sp.]